MKSCGVFSLTYRCHNVLNYRTVHQYRAIDFRGIGISEIGDAAGDGATVRASAIRGIRLGM
jgi:hypothetical protein